MRTRMKYHVIHFGCRMAEADGLEMSGPLAERGLRPTPILEEADTVLVNTCTVRQHAEDRAVSLIGRLKAWKEARPGRFLIVAGCAAERLGAEVRRKFPHVDLVVGAKSIGQYPELLESALRARSARTGQDGWSAGEEDLLNSGIFQTSPGTNRTFQPARSPEIARGGPTSGQTNGDSRATASPIAAAVTVMRGCNYRCSYCIVPSVRGPEICRPVRDILEDAARRIAEGAGEITLLGQTVNSYRSAGGGYGEGAGGGAGEGTGKGKDFSDLLRELEALPGLQRLRFMSPHPYYLNQKLIRTMAECPKVSRHLHLPLQSGSDRILRTMRRNYNVQDYLGRIEKLRRALPGLALTTDVLVGFPGETEKEFAQTLAVLGEIDPCAAYCFKFSPRPGTEAARSEGQLSREAVEDRHRRLLQFMDARTERHLRSWLGKTVHVLLEDALQGRTEFHFNARLDAPGRPGEVVAAVVTGASRTGLKATPK